MKFHLGSDHAGIELRGQVAQLLTDWGHEVATQEGPSDAESKVDYPDVALAVARAVVADPDARGVLICGTGQGMGMTANKVAGIRAAACSDCYSAKMARAHNNANVLCMGQRVLGPGHAGAVLEAFVCAEFEGGRHQRRVTKIDAARE